MAGAITDLGVAARLGLRGLRRRLRGEVEPAPDEARFRNEMDAVLGRLPAGIVADRRWVTLPANRPPWLDSGLELADGQQASYFAVGRAYASRGLDIWVSPRNQLWARIGEQGEIASSSRDSNTLRAKGAGRLYLGNYFPNDWTTRQGDRLQDDSVYSTVSGSTTAMLIAWPGEAAEGLEALRAAGDPHRLVSGEIARLRDGCGAPEGWRYLWHLGEAEVFRPARDSTGAPAIDCEVEGDVGILQRDVDLPLQPDTQISWRWKVDTLPGLLREDSVPSHDYLSIAVEFDNGWDITYFWSRTLAPGTGFVCPLPNWKHREYHVSVRSGGSGLGTWQSEARNLHEDYARYMGDPPRRIVRVWLIANSVFQRQLGRCRFADIRLRGGGREVIVL